MTDKCYAIVEFNDELQLILTKWLSGDLTRAFWPNFTNTKRYDKAVKCMEEPQCTWLKHPVLKIYGTFSKLCFFLEYIFLVYIIVILHVNKCWYF